MAEHMSRLKENAQQFGQAMLVPVSLIAISGLFLGFGGVFTSQSTMEAFGVAWDSYSTSFVYELFSAFNALGNVVIGNLGIMYAVACAFALARKEKGWAAFSAVVAFLALLAVQQVLLNANGLNAGTTTQEALQESGMTSIEASRESAMYKTYLGYFSYSFGVFGGVIVGCIVAWITNRFYNTKLPAFLSFFAGTRTVPILSLVAGGVLGIVFYFVWPIIGGAIMGLSTFVHDSGLVGSFVYRVALEALVPFGLHPLINTPIYWTELGGSMIVDGVRVVGTSGIQLAQLASPGDEKLLVRSFMGGTNLKDYAVYPGIALAMWSCAKKENRSKVAGLLIPTVIASVGFGVTEPILFTFLFAAPWLYFLVYAPLCGIGEILCEVMQVSVYQGNIKDLVPFLLRPEKLNLWPLLILIPVFFLAAFVLFRALILKFDIKTPGRDSDEDADDIHLISKAEYSELVEESKTGKPGAESGGLALAQGIVAALGGKDNIETVGNCISRLRVIVKDGSKVAEDKVFTSKLEAMGVVHISERSIQIIYGTAVGTVAADVHDVLGF